MAGSYPDPPSWRMGFDRDGTQAFRITAGVLSQVTSADLIMLNNESTDSVSLGDAVVFLFPEKRDFQGFFIRAAGSAVAVEVSSTTTNGIDGTWETVGTFDARGATVVPDYRTPTATSKSGVQGVRFTGTGVANAIHLYGGTTSGQPSDQLAFWSGWSDERIPPVALDWGTVPRTSSDDVSFRVKNLSTSLTARDVRVYMEALTDTAPSTPAQHVISAGSAYLAEQTIEVLAPGALSALLTLRRVTPSNAQLGPTTFRLVAHADSWS